MDTMLLSNIRDTLKPPESRWTMNVLVAVARALLATYVERGNACVGGILCGIFSPRATRTHYASVSVCTGCTWERTKP